MTLLSKFYIDPDRYDRVEHIRKNVASLLDAHEGYSSFLMRAGLADAWVRVPDAAAVAGLEERVQQQLHRWEPRVEVTSILPVAEQRSAPGLGRVSVRINARIRDTDQILLIDLGRERSSIRVVD